MAEKDITLQGRDDNKIYGMLNTNGQKRLVVHLHGMTQLSSDLLEVTSSEFFEENGYDHYRICLYDSPKDSRKLPNSTLSTHARDVQSVLDHFRDLYEEIFISAHSLSGLVMLIMNPSGVKAMSLWDPSTDVTNFWSTGPYLKSIPDRQEYYLDYGNVFVLGEAMVEEIKKYPDEKCLECAGKIETPTQFVIPKESIFLASPHISPEAYQTAFKGPYELQRIDAANHRFSKRNNRQQLFKHTLAFFNKHSKSE